MLRPTRLLAALLALAFVSRIASAHETDQYTVPEARDLADLRLYFSQDIYRRLQNAVNNTNERIRHSLHDGSPTPATAHLQAPLTMGWALFAEFPPALLHVAALEMQVHSEEVRARYPGLLTAFMPPHWIYDNAILRLDVFRPVRNARTSTILVNGVYFGTDKIAHFVNVGFAYFRAYESARRAGRDTEAALRSAVNVGIGVNLFYSEHTILGGLTTGVFSNADLAANYAGFTFFRNLTEAVRVRGELRPPMLVRDGELWKLADYVRPDSDFFTAFITPHWNEALNPCSYAPGIAHFVREEVESRCVHALAWYCDRQGLPRSRQRFVDELVELSTWYGEDYGYIGDPLQLVSIANCCFDDPPDPPGDSPAGDMNTAPPGRIKLADQGGVFACFALTPTAVIPDDSGDALGRTTLWWAARRGQLGRVNDLVDGGANVDAADVDGETPLHAAARAGCEAVVRALLERGARPERRSRYGMTPLHLAVQEQHLEAVVALLEHGADPDAADNFGYTPLHDAITHADLDIVQALIDDGADPRRRDQHGVSPLDQARSGRRQSVVAILESHDTAEEE